MTSKQLRQELGMSRAEWARALAVTERTVMRWEDRDHAPQGLPAALLTAIGDALAEAGPSLVARRLRRGIGFLVFSALSGLGKARTAGSGRPGKASQSARSGMAR